MDEETSSPTPSLDGTCWTCAPLETYVDLTGDFVDRLGDALHDPMLILYSSLSALWIVVSGTKLHFQMTTIHKVIEDLVYISITGLLLGSLAGGLIASVYTSSIDIMGAASSAVFSLAANERSSGYSGLAALAANGELAVAKVIQAAKVLVDSGSMMEPQYFLYALILALPYVLLVIVYASQVVVAIFRATMVGVFAPYLFMAFAFGWGRAMAQSGAKTLLASILVLFANTAALSLTIFGVNSSILDPADLIGDRIKQFASVSNPDFLVVLFLGWMGTALMTEGTSIANSIAGTLLTNTASGIMTGGVAASGTALLGASKGAALWVMKSAPSTAAVAALVEKFQSPNKPGNGPGGPGAA